MVNGNWGALVIKAIIEYDEWASKKWSFIIFVTRVTQLHSEMNQLEYICVFQLVVLNSLHSLTVRILDMDIRTSDSAEIINASSVSSSDVLQGSGSSVIFSSNFSFSTLTIVVRLLCRLLVDRVEQYERS